MTIDVEALQLLDSEEVALSDCGVTCAFTCTYTCGGPTGTSAD